MDPTRLDEFVLTESSCYYEIHIFKKAVIPYSGKMDITIEPMNKNNLKHRFDFEQENRDYFTKNLPPRPKEYFSYDSFKELMADILNEQSRNECAMYIVLNEKGVMIGRVNLTSITKGKTRKAEMGYRIGEKYQSKGYATKAVSLAIIQGLEKYNLSLIEAGTSTENRGSQKVLERNGFKRVGEEENVMQINGKLVNGYLYQRI